MSLTERLQKIVRADPILWPALQAARGLNLPDWWIVSGAIYNTVWNHLTGRAPGYGIKDIDLFYFDPDTSWDAEDRVIQGATYKFPTSPPVEIRNQARVHLWFPDHFGHTIAPLTDCMDAIAGFAARTHAIGIKLIDADQIEVCAPFGLDNVFDMKIVPNPRHPNRETHQKKAQRCTDLWSEVQVLPWPAFDQLGVSGDEDWSMVLALLHRAFAFMQDRIDPPSSLHHLSPNSLAKKAQKEICLIARKDDRPMGCLFCRPEANQLYIGKMAVEPKLQGQGVGRWLMQTAQDHARWSGLDTMVLETRIELTENHRAFARMGFRKIGETAHPGYDRPTSITMAKSI